EVLSRRNKMNVVLIGEAGVGKTAVVEGFAQRIVSPTEATFYDHSVRAWDLPAMLAGTKHRGQFEQRVINLLREVRNSGGTVISFIDELHTLFSGGGGREDSSTFDAAALLIPHLRDRSLRVIGATTLNEYRKHIEGTGLAPLFTPVHIEEPNCEQTLDILRGLSVPYGRHHRVIIPDNVLAAAVSLSDQYRVDRIFPDKAIDVVDEAAGLARKTLDDKARAQVPRAKEQVLSKWRKRIQELNDSPQNISPSQISSLNETIQRIENGGLLEPEKLEYVDLQAQKERLTSEAHDLRERERNLEKLLSTRQELVSLAQILEEFPEESIFRNVAPDEQLATLEGVLLNYYNRISTASEGFTSKEVMRIAFDASNHVQSGMTVAIIDKNYTKLFQEITAQIGQCMAEALALQAECNKQERAFKASDRESDSERTSTVVRRELLQVIDRLKELDLLKRDDRYFLNQLRKAQKRPEVTIAQVYETVAHQTGVPIDRIARDGLQLVNALRQDLSASVINQDHVIDQVVRAVARRYSGIADPNRPIGTFLFAGPRGVGMSTVASATARSLFGDEDALVYVNLGDYQTPGDISRLVGAPPGYSGYGETGYLVDKLRTNRHAVVMFDRLDLASREALNILLQILEEGRLTTGSSKKLSFKDTLIMLTTGAAERAFYAPASPPPNNAKKKFDWFRDGPITETARPRRLVEQQAESLLTSSLPPELINRTTPIIFNVLGVDSLEQILLQKFESYNSRLFEYRGIQLELTPRAREFLLASRTNIRAGAHGISSQMENTVGDLVSEYLMSSADSGIDRLVVDLSEDELSLVCSRG
ncbi:MAG: AAA family ATPase, partial [Bdellovibrionales bacterium]|nr:AAA family ATPase [Bdellovibrionales bacterium]